MKGRPEGRAARWKQGLVAWRTGGLHATERTSKHSPEQRRSSDSTLNKLQFDSIAGEVFCNAKT